VKEFIEVTGSPLAAMVSDDVMQTLAAESEDALVEFVVPSGEVVMPMDAHIVTASKARSRFIGSGRDKMGFVDAKRGQIKRLW
jgi:hypothetical protein